MHTRKINGYRFHFNSDGSGDLSIVPPNSGEFIIQFDVLREFLNGPPFPTETCGTCGEWPTLTENRRGDKICSKADPERWTAVFREHSACEHHATGEQNGKLERLAAIVARSLHHHIENQGIDHAVRVNDREEALKIAGGKP